MRPIATVVLCLALLAASCGEPAPAAPPDLAETAQQDEGGVRPPEPAEGVPAPVEVRDGALVTGRERWDRHFLSYVTGHQVYVADAVAPTGGPSGRWEYRVVRPLGDRADLRSGESLTGIVPEVDQVLAGGRWVLLGNWHKPGFHVIGAWRHSEAVEDGIEHLLATVAALRDTAHARDPERWARGFAQELRRRDVLLARVLGSDAAAPEAGESLWRFQVEEVLYDEGRPGPRSYHVTAALGAELAEDSPVILVTAGHAPQLRVYGWWPRTPETLAALRRLVATFPDR